MGGKPQSVKAGFIILHNRKMLVEDFVGVS